MIVVIDTSSLLSLVRYYLPFDKNGVLYNFIKNKIEKGEIIVLDKVYDECRYISKGLVIETLEYLKDKKNHHKTIDILPTPKFFSQLENQFINGSAKNKLSPVQFEERKNAFLESADAKLILYCSQKLVGLKFEKIVLVTEETETSNDNKAFKKLPAICKMLDIEVLTLPELLNLYQEIDLQFL